MESDEDASKSHLCCSNFWGPFRPLLGGHSLAEAATSAFLPTFVIAYIRVAFSVTLLATCIYYTIIERYSFIHYSIWCHLGLGLSFALTSAVSIVFLISPPAHTDSDHPSVFASLAVIFYQIFATAALYLDVVFWALLSDGSTSFPVLIQHAINFIFVLIDMSLSMRMQFKLIYSVIFIFYTLIYVAFAWIRFSFVADFPYGFLDYRTQSNAKTVVYYVALIAWGIVASLILFVFSRASRLPCFPAVPHQSLRSPSQPNGRNGRTTASPLDDDEDDHDDLEDPDSPVNRLRAGNRAPPE